MIISIKSDILVTHGIRYESVFHYRDLKLAVVVRDLIV
jgi:hypothetical protein